MVLALLNRQRTQQAIMTTPRQQQTALAELWRLIGYEDSIKMGSMPGVPFMVRQAPHSVWCLFTSSAIVPGFQIYYFGEFFIYLAGRYEPKQCVEICASAADVVQYIHDNTRRHELCLKRMSGEF